MTMEQGRRLKLLERRVDALAQEISELRTLLVRLLDRTGTTP